MCWLLYFLIKLILVWATSLYEQVSVLLFHPWDLPSLYNLLFLKIHSYMESGFHNLVTSLPFAMALLLAASLALLQFSPVRAVPSLDANTTSGLVKGFINETTPNVAQFLGIPYAEPPVGARRFLPAVPKSREHGVINATRFGCSCPQFNNDPSVDPSVYNVDAPNFLPRPLDYQSEDCLSLNIYTPWHGQNATQNTTEPLPILLWVYGGGYYSGGGNVPYQCPAPWVERSGKHLVVTLK
jgi:acetylcholinesterase